MLLMPLPPGPALRSAEPALPLCVCVYTQRHSHTHTHTHAHTLSVWTHKLSLSHTHTHTHYDNLTESSSVFLVAFIMLYSHGPYALNIKGTQPALAGTQGE